MAAPEDTKSHMSSQGERGLVVLMGGRFAMGIDK